MQKKSPVQIGIQVLLTLVGLIVVQMLMKQQETTTVMMVVEIMLDMGVVFLAMWIADKVKR